RRLHPTRGAPPAPAAPSLSHQAVASAVMPSLDVIAQLGATEEIGLLRDRIATWVERCDEDLRDPLAWAFSGSPKHFRPLTLFACHRGVHERPRLSEAVELAFAVELAHNMSLIIDDVLDESQTRRGLATIQCRFGRLPALMASGYLVADAFDAFAEDPFAVRQLAELLRRLGAAECLQWRLRRQPLGVEDWRRIAGEDTGSMFGDWPLLGVLYHGCDDVADQRGVEALGGGGEEDIRDGILTLPAALAIRDPRIRELFGRDDEDPRRLAILTEACREQLDGAESVLDRIADSARTEAAQFAAEPGPLIALVDHVRLLSRR